MGFATFAHSGPADLSSDHLASSGALSHLRQFSSGFRRQSPGRQNRKSRLVSRQRPDLSVKCNLSTALIPFSMGRFFPDGEGCDPADPREYGATQIRREGLMVREDQEWFGWKGAAFRCGA